VGSAPVVQHSIVDDVGMVAGLRPGCPGDVRRNAF
jgi:hypothetical protein